MLTSERSSARTTFLQSCNIDRQFSSAGYFNWQGDCQVESYAGFQFIPDDEIDSTVRDVLSPAGRDTAGVWRGANIVTRSDDEYRHTLGTI